MPLPKVQHPTFDLILPSTKEKYTFRPFLVKEEKILLMAAESGEPKDIVRALKQIITNTCIQNIDCEKLATFDLEYIFLKLRAFSVNNIVKLTYRDLEDNKTYDFEVDLNKIEVEHNPLHTKDIKINDILNVQLKYPSTKVLEELKEGDDIVFALLRSSIDKIIENDTVYNVGGHPVEELDTFLELLDVNSLMKIREFLDTMPKIKHELKYTNSLGHEKTITLNKLQDFFTLG